MNKDSNITLDTMASSLIRTAPVACLLVDSEYRYVLCNDMLLQIFGADDRKVLDGRFYNYAPKLQPDGTPSAEKAKALADRVVSEGKTSDLWTVESASGDVIATNLTMVKVPYAESYCIAIYLTDIRERLTDQDNLIEANERAQMLLDATPMSCNLWDEQMNNVLCNQAAVTLFELDCKQEFLDKFFELSPEFQPDGLRSIDKANSKIAEAFEKGMSRFEWLHQKLDGTSIPAEVTLVKVPYKGDNHIAGFVRDLRELKNAIAALNHLERLAFTDTLTGIFNRRHFVENAKIEFLNRDNKLAPISIIMFDIDRFKSINDTYGHMVGDEVLKAVCNSIRISLRPSDLFARYGGEEFVLLAVNTSLDDAFHLAERVRIAVEETDVIINDKTLNVTISLGVATKNDEDDTFEEVIQKADEALYRAKDNGRNRVEI